LGGKLQNTSYAGLGWRGNDRKKDDACSAEGKKGSKGGLHKTEPWVYREKSSLPNEKRKEPFLEGGGKGCSAPGRPDRVR